jgi:hypothetical protein
MSRHTTRGATRLKYIGKLWPSYFSRIGTSLTGASSNSMKPGFKVLGSYRRKPGLLVTKLRRLGKTPTSVSQAASAREDTAHESLAVLSEISHENIHFSVRVLLSQGFGKSSALGCFGTVRDEDKVSWREKGVERHIPEDPYSL